MTMQARVNIDTTPFILYSYPGKREDDATILQDAGRATDLAPFTLMAKVSASGKWVPFTDIAAVDGSAIPQGIFHPGNNGGAIATADIVAGDVLDVPIITFGVEFDETKLIIENSLTLDTILAVGTIHERTVRDALKSLTLIATPARQGSKYENA